MAISVGPKANDIVECPPGDEDALGEALVGSLRADIYTNRVVSCVQKFVKESGASFGAPFYMAAIGVADVSAHEAVHAYGLPGHESGERPDGGFVITPTIFSKGYDIPFAMRFGLGWGPLATEFLNGLFKQ